MCGEFVMLRLQSIMCVVMEVINHSILMERASQRTQTGPFIGCPVVAHDAAAFISSEAEFSMPFQ